MSLEQKALLGGGKRGESVLGNLGLPPRDPVRTFVPERGGEEAKVGEEDT